MAVTDARLATKEAADRLWTIEDVMTYLSIPRSTIYKLTSARGARRLPHIKMGALLRFRKADIDSWLELQLVSNTSLLLKIRNRARGVRNGHNHANQAAQR